MSTMAMPQPTASEAAVRYLITNYSPKGNKVGWLMMASILVEAWDLYSIAFVLIFIKEQFNPDPLMLGLAAAGTQGGALIGALLGGWLSDKIGRRVMFLVDDGDVHRAGAGAGLRAERRLARSSSASCSAFRSAATSRPATPTSWNPWPRVSARSWAIAGSSCSRSVKC